MSKLDLAVSQSIRGCFSQSRYQPLAFGCSAWAGRFCFCKFYLDWLVHRYYDFFHQKISSVKCQTSWIKLSFSYFLVHLISQITLIDAVVISRHKWLGSRSTSQARLESGCVSDKIMHNKKKERHKIFTWKLLIRKNHGEEGNPL